MLKLVTQSKKTMKSCASCGTEFEGKFCPACGQRVVNLPLTFHSIAVGAWEMVDFNRGFFYTLYTGLIRPKVLVHGYLAGRTRTFNNPIRFMVVVTTLFGLLDYIRTSGTTEEIKVWQWLLVISILFSVLMLCNWLAFRKSWTVAEHAIAATYLATLLYFIVSFFTLLFLYLESYEMLDYNEYLVFGFAGPLTIIYLFYFNVTVYSSSILRKVLMTGLSLLVTPAAIWAFAQTVKYFRQ